jgi:hypothetical protein
MSADGKSVKGSDPFLEKYREWFEIVLYEHKAIRDENWTELTRHVKQKEEIMKSLQDLETIHPAWKKQKSEALNLLIHQLSDMEQLNHNLVEEKSKHLKVKVDDIHKRLNTVRQLRDRYIAHIPKAGKKISRQG